MYIVTWSMIKHIFHVTLTWTDVLDDEDGKRFRTLKTETHSYTDWSALDTCLLIFGYACHTIQLPWTPCIQPCCNLKQPVSCVYVRMKTTPLDEFRNNNDVVETRHSKNSTQNTGTSFLFASVIIITTIPRTYTCLDVHFASN